MGESLSTIFAYISISGTVSYKATKTLALNIERAQHDELCQGI